MKDYWVQYKDTTSYRIKIPANSKDEAQDIFEDGDIDYGESEEISDANAGYEVEEVTEVPEDECPLGGDTANDCDGCIYRGDYEFDKETGECVRRKDADEDKPKDEGELI